MNRKLLLGLDPEDTFESYIKLNSILKECLPYIDGVKIQMACYAHHQKRMEDVARFCQKHGKYVLLDGKWSDVPHTMEKYAKNFSWADGVTVSPLFGEKSLEPFKNFFGDVFVVCVPTTSEFYLNRLPQDVIGNHILDFSVVVGANKIKQHEVFLRQYQAKVLAPGVGAQGAEIPQYENCYIPIGRGIFEAEDPVSKCKEYYNLVHNQ